MSVVLRAEPRKTILIPYKAVGIGSAFLKRFVAGTDLHLTFGVESGHTNGVIILWDHIDTKGRVVASQDRSAMSHAMDATFSGTLQKDEEFVVRAVGKLPESTVKLWISIHAKEIE